MNEESASSPASPKPEHGSSSGVAAALETAPELVRLLPNADRFAGIGLLAVLTLFALALWQGPKTVTGEVSQGYVLWLIGIGSVSMIVLVVIGVLGRTTAKSVADVVVSAATSAIEAAPAPEGAALKLTGTETIYTSPLIEVVRGHDETLQRRVAKKILLDPERRDDFVAGAREAIKISDLPNFTGIYAGNFEAEQPYILMQYINGGTLRDFIESQGASRISAEVARRIVFAIGDAMLRAHRHSVRLGNIKASNILLDENDDPWISPRTSLTFVNAKQLRDAVKTVEVRLEDIVYAAPELLSPEHARDARGDLCDQYSLGILAYELMTSILPPTLPTITEQPEAARLEKTCRLLVDKGLSAYVSLTPVHEMRRDIPTRIGEVIARMTAVDPQKRYAHLEHALAALRSVERTNLLIVRDSFVRCLEQDSAHAGDEPPRPTFLEAFYDAFTADDVVRERFASFTKEQWTAQHGKLRASIEACFDFAQVLDPKLDIPEPNSMSALARKHGPGGLHITEREYRLFVDALVATVCGVDRREPYDPACTSPERREEIERAWRELLTPITAYFAR